MKFGIVTPVFDGCLESLELLSREILLQTHGDWTWMVCSNGRSSKIAAFTRTANRRVAQGRGLVARAKNFLSPRITCPHLPFEETSDLRSLLVNIGKRRNFCIQRIKADYIFTFDADAKLLDSDMFQIIAGQLRRDPKDLCVYRVLHEVGVLPFFPIQYGHIDMLNFCVSARLAKKIGFPTDLAPNGQYNDYRYFHRAVEATGGEYLFIDQLFGQHNGNNNNSYKNFLRQMAEQRVA